MATKVLIVEDDSNIAQLLQLYLEKEGFETSDRPGRRQGRGGCSAPGNRIWCCWTSCCP